MAIALRAALGSKTTSAGTTLTMTVPTGTANGDIMVMCCLSRSTATIPALPSGWTNLGTVTGTSTTPSARLSWRVAASEPASYAVTTASVQSAGSIISLSGADSTQPAAAEAALQGNASSATVTIPALGTFASSNGIDVAFGQVQTSSTTTTAPPSTYTEPAAGIASSGGTGTTAVKSEVAYKSLSAVTTVGQLTETWGSSGANIGAHVFIKEAGGGGPAPDASQFFPFF